MKFLNALFGGIWGYLIVGGFAATLSAFTTCAIVIPPLKLQISNLKLASATQAKQDTQQALDKLTSYIGRMNASALDYQWALQHIQDQFGKVNHELSAIQKQKPLPPDCKPDADRLRNLAAAVVQTNSATAVKPGIGATMPHTIASPSPRK